MASLRCTVACVATTLMMLLMIVPSSEGAAKRGPYIKKKPPVVVQPIVPAVEPDVQGNSNPLAGPIQVKGTATDAEALRHIEELENTVTTIKQDKVQLEQALHSLRLVTINLQNELQSVASKVTELDRIATNNRELTRLLTYFETFFGVLYREESETFNPNVPVETRLSRLNTYIGNRDAELVALRSKPDVTTLPDTNGVSEEVTNAVLQLSEDNSRLAAKVSTLEADVATTTAEVKSKLAGGPTSRIDGGGCACNSEEIEERLGLVERTTAVLVSPVINAADSTTGSATPSKKKAGTTVDLLTIDDIDLLRDMQFESRGASDSRKSVFSAIRHSHMLGDDVRQTLSFDTVHVNKGNNFHNNSVFVCEQVGFYFFHYTVRSYDGHYMGVALVKDGEMMTSVYTDASERSIMQSQSTVLHMSRGERVWLELGSSERFAVHSDVHKYVTFNGFLVYKGR